MEFNIRQRKAINATENKVLCLAPPASGKAISCDTILPTPQGFKIAKYIKVGDTLFDENGEPTKVLGVFPQGELFAYKVTFEDGRTSICNSEHIWNVGFGNGLDEIEFKNMTLQEIMDCGNSVAVGYEPYIPLAKATKITNPSKPAIPAFYLGVYDANNDKNFDSTMLFKSVSDRRKYLCGMFSVIGDVSIFLNDEGTLTYYKISIHTDSVYAKYIAEIFYSLGYKCEVIPDANGNSSTVMPKISPTEISFLMTPRSWDIVYYNEDMNYNIKKIIELCSDRKSSCYDKYLQIVNIERMKKTEEMVCFYVDSPNHLFLTEDFIVTHNTKVLTARIERLLKEDKIAPQDIVAITFTCAAAEEMKKRLGELGKDIFVGTVHSYANKICTMNGINTGRLIANEEFDKILEKARTIPRKKYPPVKHLLIDECQDLTEVEYRFLEKIPTENIFYVGDSRQNIYGFRGGTDKFLVDMCEDMSYKKYYLTQNYRNVRCIVDFAENFISSLRTIGPSSEVTKTNKGSVVECSFYDVLDEIEGCADWGDWFILTRTNDELERAQEILNEQGIPNVTFKRGSVDSDELNRLMKSNKVKVLTIHTSKGLESKKVAVIGAKLYNEEERKIAYVAATRAEDELYWCPSIVNRWKKKKPIAKKKKNNFGNNGMIDF